MKWYRPADTQLPPFLPFAASYLHNLQFGLEASFEVCYLPFSLSDKLNEIVFVWICGLTDSPKPEMSKEEKDQIMRQQTSIKDVRRWKTVVDVVAVALSVITTAIFGFFA